MALWQLCNPYFTFCTRRAENEEQNEDKELPPWSNSDDEDSNDENGQLECYTELTICKIGTTQDCKSVQKHVEKLLAEEKSVEKTFGHYQSKQECHTEQ